MESSVTTESIVEPKPKPEPAPETPPPQPAPQPSQPPPPKPPTKRARHRPTLGHTHGPNFGRYVEGCPVCAKKYPNGPPPPPESKVKAEPPPVVPGVTMEQVMELLAANQQQVQSTGTGLSMDQLMAFATELRKPDPEVVAEREERRKRLIEAKRQNAEAARVEIEQRDKRQTACSHKMPRGENAISGQMHSDGLIHPICVICQKMFTPYRPAAEQMAMGMA